MLTGGLINYNQKSSLLIRGSVKSGRLRDEDHIYPQPIFVEFSLLLRSLVTHLPNVYSLFLGCAEAATGY
jgi:hypothetical protein